TVVASNIVCGPIEAALANGVLAHADETDDAIGTGRANRQSRQREPGLRWPALLRWGRTRCSKRPPSQPLYPHRRAQILSPPGQDVCQNRKSSRPAYPERDVSLSPLRPPAVPALAPHSY